MTTRPAQRTLTGRPVGRVDVALGWNIEGRPQITLQPYGYNRTDIPLADPEVVRGLLLDLETALNHLGETV